MYEIRKKLKFEMAHKLTRAYSKECKENIHGHSFIVELFFKCSELDKNGFVIDFKKIKNELKFYIDSFDHSLLLSSEEDSELLNVCLKNLKKVKIVGFNPTAERLCKVLYDDIKKIFPNLSKVRLHETEDGYAEYYKEK